MKVCFIITRSENCGGANVYVRELAKAFVENGDKAIVLAGENGPFFDELTELKIPFVKIKNLIRPINPLRDILAFIEIRNTLKQIHPDIVSTNSSKAGLIGRLAANSLKIPVTFTAHGWAFSEGIPETKRKIFVLVERFAAKFCNKIITVSEYDRTLAIKEGICNPDKLITIHNGMPDIPENLIAKPEQNPPIITMVARFQEPKDHPTLIKALAQLKDFDWHLNLVGDGPLKSKIEKLVRDLDLTERVTFLGQRNDVPEILAKSQIFTLITNWEGLPLSIIEAMRAGLPVIASNVGGIPELIKHEENSYFFNRDNTQESVHYFQQLLLEGKKRQTFGENSRKNYNKCLTFQCCFNKVRSVFGEIM